MIPMALPSFQLNERRKRNFERIDNAVCIAIFLAASMPAIVVMMLLSLPLLPLFGVILFMGANPVGRAEPQSEAVEADDGTHEHGPGRPAAPTPRFA